MQVALPDPPTAGNSPALLDALWHALTLRDMRTLSSAIKTPAVIGTAQFLLFQQCRQGFTGSEAVGNVITHMWTIGR